MDLRRFIELLEREGELTRVRAEVDPYLEMAEIADRASKARGPALLFERPKAARGAPAIPVLMNQLGSFRRLELALGAPLDELAQRIAGLLELQVPSGLVGKVKALGQLKELASSRRGRRRRPPSARSSSNLPTSPACPCSRPGRATAARSSRCPSWSPRTARGAATPACTACRSTTAQTTGMHWHVHHDGAANFREADGRLEVAVALGTDPAITYAATAPLPPGIDEFMFAGFLRGEPVELAPCATVDLEVPADAEIVLEGYVEKGETRLEGPFGDHTGYYSLADQYPVFHVTAMTHRRDPIYPATIVGRPPMEDAYLGKATERLFLPLLRLVLPEIVDMDLPIEGVFHNCAIVSIRKTYPGQARKVMSAVWGMGQMMFTKFVVVVDEHVDVHDYQRGDVARVQQRRPAPRLPHRRRPARRARPLEPATRATAPRWASTRRRPGPRRATAASGRTSSPRTRTSCARVSERWAEFGLPFA